MSIEKLIFENLLYNSQYFIQVWPHLKADYFEQHESKILYKLMKKHIDTYKTVPTKSAIGVMLDRVGLQPEVDQAVRTLLEECETRPEDLQWLIDTTEEHCQMKAVYNATSRIIEIQDNAQRPAEERDKKIPELGAIVDIMREAMMVCFDVSVGHDWFDDYEKRFMLYQSKANKIPFLIPILNRITKGGGERGTLNVILAGVNVGKSLGLCSLAADYMKSGYNVLYISMEMAEHVCAKRIDANLLDVSLDDLDDGKIEFKEYKARMDRLKSADKAMGRLVIKQYPTCGANVNHFRALLADLKMKKGFIPDVIVVDYLGICASSRVRAQENSYTLVKAIAEELRGLAVETNTLIWTGAQTQRGAWDSSDIDMADVAESAGLPATADFMLAAIETEELAQMGLQLMKQIKSRYGDKNYFNRFNVGVKKGNQRWYAVDNDAFKASKEESQPATNTEKQQHAKQVSKDVEQSRRSLEELANMVNF